MDYERDLIDDLVEAVGGVDYVGAASDDDLLRLLGGGDVGATAMMKPAPMGKLPAAITRKIASAVRRRTAAPSTSTLANLGAVDELRAAIKKGVAEKRMSALERRSLAQKQPTILLGIDSQTSIGRDIAANETITIATEAVDRMRITDFQVRAAIAGDFLIGRIQVQRTNLLSGGAPVPADVFASPDRPPLESPILYPGTELLVEVINLVGADRRFTGQFRGIDLDEDR
jgi:hypothetical protein